MQTLFDLLFPPRADEKILREIPLAEFCALERPGLVPETRPASVSLLTFGDPRVRAALHEAKYHGSGRAFRYLGAVLADYLSDMDEGFTKSIIIVPVPLGQARLRERGFNQAEEIARLALHSLGEELFTLDASLLERVKETESQVNLERERREKNMRGAFKATRRADPDSVYLLLDDTLTTGATLQAAIDALRAAGAERIIPLALAH
ncbi:ComF family protein [Candidatus Kaiserbacteria bacterium]|nr:ComF family protein [Candidatus Kaiserbacteria bacterium]